VFDRLSVTEMLICLQQLQKYKLATRFVFHQKITYLAKATPDPKPLGSGNTLIEFGVPK
jgi:hypothetical protein